MAFAVAEDGGVDARERIRRLEECAEGVQLPLPDPSTAPRESFPATDAETRDRLRELGYLE